MIDEKKIDEAANKHIETEYARYNSGEVEKEMICFRGKDSFKAGAKWAIDELLNGLWHDASEEPKENHDILVESLNGTYTEYAAYRHNSAQLWSDFVDRSYTTRWLYIDDLLK